MERWWLFKPAIIFFRPNNKHKKNYWILIGCRERSAVLLLHECRLQTVSDWLKTKKKPPRTNQIRAVLTTKFKKMDYDEQSLYKQLSKCLTSLAAWSVLLISKRQYTSCKRRTLIIEDEFKNTYFCWLFSERNES